MSYATKATMIARFGEPEVVALTDRSNFGEIDDTVLDGALADADTEIEPYLASRYSLPLSNVPKILAGFACDIARYRLCGAGVTETDEVRNRYKDAIRFLENVMNEKISLGLDAANIAPAAPASVQVSAAARVFDSNALEGY